ncbi:septum formation initiator family protein [Candidatus Babeliales bacterium]|nr:septum formation initiator family protein [Candidatus Babeliales bacterium]MBY0353312.1 septum formation initiator family protein [Candidatus Babeliales bacterium]
MQKKHLIQGALLLMLGIGMGHYLVFNPNGLQMQKRLKATIAQEQTKVDDLKQKIAALEQELTTWREDSFYQEKLAREDLLMSYTNEMVYFIK